MSEHVRLLWRWLLEHVGSTSGAVAAFCAALAVHAAESLVWPVAEGRDYVTYMRVYAEMWHWESVIPWELMWRMPLAPALLGPPLDVGGPTLARIAIAVAFAATIVVWLRVGLRFGPATALLLPAALLAYPAFGVLFHRYSSDAVTGLVFAGFALALARAYERPSPGRFVVLGAAIVAMALTRPANQVLLVFVLFPLVLRVPAGTRLRWAGLCAAVALVPLAAWAGLNGARHDDLALSRGGGAWLPFYRAYLTDDLIDPGNGSASKELADAVARDLLVREPYRSYGIDLETFFSAPTTRYHEDLVSLSDRVWGWDDRYSVLRRAALEGIRKRPGAFARGLASSFWTQLTQTFVFLPPAAVRHDTSGETVVVDGKPLPQPSEGGTIPSASVSYWLGRPDNAFDEVWTSPTEHHVVSTSPDLLDDLERMQRRVAELALPPSGDGSAWAARWLNRASRLYPPVLAWLVVGLVGLAVRRPRSSGLVLSIVLAASLILVATVLSVPPAPEFLMPLFPAFVLLGLVGLVGERPATRAAG